MSSPSFSFDLPPEERCFSNAPYRQRTYLILFAAKMAIKMLQVRISNEIYRAFLCNL